MQLLHPLTRWQVSSYNHCVLELVLLQLAFPIDMIFRFGSYGTTNLNRALPQHLYNV